MPRTAPPTGANSDTDPNGMSDDLRSLRDNDLSCVLLKLTWPFTGAWR